MELELDFQVKVAHLLSSRSAVEDHDHKTSSMHDCLSALMEMMCAYRLARALMGGGGGGM